MPCPRHFSCPFCVPGPRPTTRPPSSVRGPSCAPPLAVHHRWRPGTRSLADGTGSARAGGGTSHAQHSLWGCPASRSGRQAAPLRLADLGAAWGSSGRALGQRHRKAQHTVPDLGLPEPQFPGRPSGAADASQGPVRSGAPRLGSRAASGLGVGRGDTSGNGRWDQLPVSPAQFWAQGA